MGSVWRLWGVFTSSLHRQESPFNQTFPLPLNSLPLNLSPKPRRPHEAGKGGGCNNQRAGSTRLAGKIVTAMKFNRLKFRHRVQTKTKVRSPKWNLAEGPIGRGEGRLPLGPPFKMAAADDQLASRTGEPVGSSVRAGEGCRVGCREGGGGVGGGKVRTEGLVLGRQSSAGFRRVE